VLWTRERADLHVSLAAQPDLACGIPGLIAGGLAVLALNDSGVIAISTLAPFAMLLALTLAARGRGALATADTPDAATPPPASDPTPDPLP